MKHEKYDITGMSCSACSTRVEKAVSKLDGMNKASVNLLTNSMQVDYDENVLTSQGIIDAVVNAGYGAALEGGGGGGGSNATATQTSASDTAAKEMKKMKSRLIWSIIWLIPLMFIAMHHMIFMGLGITPPTWFTDIFHGPENAITFAFSQFLLVLPIMYLNKKYYVNGFRTLIQGAPNMDSLVGMGSMASSAPSLSSASAGAWVTAIGPSSTCTARTCTSNRPA